MLHLFFAIIMKLYKHLNSLMVWIWSCLGIEIWNFGIRVFKYGNCWYSMVTLYLKDYGSIYVWVVLNVNLCFNFYVVSDKVITKVRAHAWDLFWQYGLRQRTGTSRHVYSSLPLWYLGVSFIVVGTCHVQWRALKALH